MRKHPWMIMTATIVWTLSARLPASRTVFRDSQSSTQSIDRVRPSSMPLTPPIATLLDRHPRLK